MSSGIDHVKRKIAQGIRKVAPSLAAITRGKRQMLPVPMAIPRAARISPSGEENRSEARSGSRGVLAIRQGPWKLIPELGSGGFSQPSRVKPSAGGPRGQLYHLTDDPGETANLWSEQPQIVDRLTKLLQRYKNQGRSR